MTQEDWEYLAGKIWNDKFIADHARWLELYQERWAVLWVVWTWATKQEWWVKFITYALNHEADPIDGIKVHDFCAWLVEPTSFPVLVVDFLREREKGEKE